MIVINNYMEVLAKAIGMQSKIEQQQKNKNKKNKRRMEINGIEN